MNRKHFVNSIDADALLNHVLESVDGILQLANISTGIRTQMLNEIRDKEVAWIDRRTSESNSELCPYCDGAEPLVIGKTNDVGIAIKQETEPIGPVIIAYGYDMCRSDTHVLRSFLMSKINYCPICGKSLRQKHSEE